MKLIVNSPEALARAVSVLKREYHKHPYQLMTLLSGRARTLNQNAQLHAWIEQLVTDGGEMTFDEYKAFCKLKFFMPILIRDDEHYKNQVEAAMPPNEILEQLPIDQRKAYRYRVALALAHIIPATSLCNTEQMSEGMEKMQKHFATLDVDPVFLEFTEKLS